jgi:hypothetical protein
MFVREWEFSVKLKVCSYCEKGVHVDMDIPQEHSCSRMSVSKTSGVVI